MGAWRSAGWLSVVLASAVSARYAAHEQHAFGPEEMVEVVEAVVDGEPLNIAPALENDKTLRRWLKQGGKLNTLVFHGDRQLRLLAFFAAAHDAPVRYFSVMRTLLSRGADPDAISPDDGGTALMEASYAAHVGIVRLLLARGARVNLVDNVGGSALRELRAARPCAAAGPLRSRPAARA